MAEIILAVLAIIVGIVCLGFALLSFGANAIGGVTAPDRVDHGATFISLALAIGFIALGIWLF